MSPDQIADSILSTRFPTTHPGTAFYQNARTMIVDGIERALAERPRPIEDNPDARAVARRVAAYYIGDASWADLIVGAFLNPVSAQQSLDAERRS